LGSDRCGFASGGVAGAAEAQNDIDVLNPPPEVEKLNHKKELLVQPSSSMVLPHPCIPPPVFILERAFSFLSRTSL